MSKTIDSLTDRYVAAVLKGVPDNQRDDVAAELRASIADAVDAQTASGVSRDTAERAVLTELGDPIRLSAEYSGRPLYLIGPAHYPDYVRLLRLLLSIVVPIVAVVVGAASALGDSGMLDVVLSGVGAAFTVGVQLAFWVTVVFAIIDRRGGPTQTSTWEVDDLPEIPDPGVGLGDTVASIVGLALLMWLLLWQPGYQETLNVGGPSIPVLDPGLSAFWIPFLVAVLLASIALEIVKYRTGRWTVTLAGINTALSLAFALPAIWLLTSDRLFNPEFLSASGISDFAPLLDVAPAMIALAIGIITVIDIADGWRKALR